MLFEVEFFYLPYECYIEVDNPQILKKILKDVDVEDETYCHIVRNDKLNDYYEGFYKFAISFKDIDDDVIIYLPMNPISHLYDYNEIDNYVSFVFNQIFTLPIKTFKDLHYGEEIQSRITEEDKNSYPFIDDNTKEKI